MFLKYLLNFCGRSQGLGEPAWAGLGVICLSVIHYSNKCAETKTCKNIGKIPFILISLSKQKIFNESLDMKPNLCSKKSKTFNTDNTYDNSYIHWIPIRISRVRIRYRTTGLEQQLKGNLRHSWDDLACPYCELRNWRDHLLFCRRMTVKIAVVTKKKGPDADV